MGQTRIKTNNSAVGESLEQIIRRMLANKEPIKAEITPMYTDRKEGVLPETDPRTDRWELALEAVDKTTRAAVAMRDNIQKPEETTPQE